MRHRRWLSLAGASLALALTAGPVTAGDPDTTVTLLDEAGKPTEQPVCEFYLWFSPVPGGETGSWELYDEGGKLVAGDTYEVTASEGDRAPANAPLALDDGRYSLWWDDEAPVDASRDELEIVVDCEEVTPAPVETPTPTPAPVETPAPTGTVAPATPTPAGTVAAETGAPRITPPATDGPSTGQGGLGGLPIVLLVLASASALGLLLPSRRLGRR